MKVIGLGATERLAASPPHAVSKTVTPSPPLRASDFDRTIVRPLALAEGPATGRARGGCAPTERGLSLEIACADIAGFLRRQIGEQSAVRRAVAIST